MAAQMPNTHIIAMMPNIQIWVIVIIIQSSSIFFPTENSGQDVAENGNTNNHGGTFNDNSQYHK